MANRILILTNDSTDAKTLEAVLDNARDGPFEIECLERLDAALTRLNKGGIDLVLVDLSLAECQGIETFKSLFAAFPRIPILTLSAREEEPLAIEAVHLGAQGYLSKGYFASSLVPQALRSIIQRKIVEELLYKEKAWAPLCQTICRVFF